MMPAVWAASSADATWAPILVTSADDNGPERASCSASDPPVTSSITTYSVPSSVPASNTVTAFG